MEEATMNGAPLAIAVDLTPLRPGGLNGGIKPAIFTMLNEAGRLAGDSLFFIYLTRSSTHAEVRQLARPGDLLVCLTESSEHPLDLQEGEFFLPNPPEDLLRRIGASLLYAPFGACTYATEGVPALALIADLLHRDYPHTLNEPQIAEREAFIQHTVQSARMLQSISRNGVERLMLQYKVPEEKIFFTYLPVQVRLDRGAPKPAPQETPKMPRGPYFFYPANLWKHKNHETLLLAYRLYRQRAGKDAWDLVLTFHEEEQRAREIRALIGALGIEQHVCLPGYVSDAALRELWRNAGALVFPSLHEGFGIPLIEAMHYGVPIISSPDFSLREIAGDAALIIDPRKPESIADALAKVAGNATLRASLQSRGERRLELFDLTIETEKLIEAWKTCAQSQLGFPRKPLVLETKAAVAVPAPASKALWTIEVRVSGDFPQNRYRCYLDDASFGSFTSEQCTAFRFGCQPRGRTLRVVVDRRARCNTQPCEENAIQAVVATDPQGNCIPLFVSTQENGI